MKKQLLLPAILILLFTFLSSTPGSSGYELTCKNNYDYYYIVDSTIRKFHSSNVYNLWVRVKNNTEEIIKGRNVDYYYHYYTIDCQKKQFLINQILAYDKQGKYLDRKTTVHIGWEKLSPKSCADTIAQKVCNPPSLKKN